MRRTGRAISRAGRIGLVVCVSLLGSITAARAEPVVQLLAKPHDPYGVPRPAPGQKSVPLRTTFYVELALHDGATGDIVEPESVAINLEPEGAPAYPILQAGRQFPGKNLGKFVPGNDDRLGPTLAVYVDPEQPLRPATNYTVRLAAQSRKGATLPEKAGTWQFTTEAAPKVHAVQFDLDLTAPAVQWHGGFFTGFCSVGFCTSAENRIPTYELMAAVRKSSPRAWSLQRDFWMTGMEHQPGFLTTNLPNIVRERETRRIVTVEDDKDTTLLKVEDFFGHAQYRIPSNRHISADYHAGDEVLIADGTNDAKGKVLSVDDGHHIVRITRLTPPKGGWKVAYSAPLPTKENPDAPGLFPPGGCYLRKLNPCGTPTYYWGRLDREWDLDHRRFQHRLLPNFADAPGDLSIDGRSWTTAKDYVELRETTRAITDHIIERYGAAALEFPWSVFNEPDLGTLFWRTDWEALQTFYDYTVDGILRAFEDRGYDSTKVFVGGLELGGIFGPSLRLKEFLVHCSPTATEVKGAVLLNAAFADKRLDGKRSKRVENLCRAHAGRGSPCDFISIHAYNQSSMMADKLARAKEMALEIDPDYYAKLWVNSHESCPGWAPPPDPAYADSYLGNGYYPTWCADVARRQLQRAAKDARYSFGESILTAWTWPTNNFDGVNDCVRAIHIDDDGDGIADRTVTIATPVLHFLGLLNRMGPEFRVLPERKIGEHVVSGFASRSGERQYVLVYAHQALDTESRSGQQFDITLNVTGLSGKKMLVEHYGFDQELNSYFRRGRELREQAEPMPVSKKTREERLHAALQDLGSGQRESQLNGLEIVATLGRAAQPALGAIVQLIQKTDDNVIREKANATLKRVVAPRAYPASILKEIQPLSELHETGRSRCEIVDGHLDIKVRIRHGNGAEFLILQPESTP